MQIPEVVEAQRVKQSDKGENWKSQLLLSLGEGDKPPKEGGGVQQGFPPSLLRDTPVEWMGALVSPEWLGVLGVAWRTKA